MAILFYQIIWEAQLHTAARKYNQMDAAYNQRSVVQRGQGATLVAHLEHLGRHLQELPRAIAVADFGCGPGGNSEGPLRAVRGDGKPLRVWMVDNQESEILWDQLKNTLSDVGILGEMANLVRRSFYEPLPEIPDAELDVAWCAVAAHWLPELPTAMPQHVVANELPDGNSIREAWRKAACDAWGLFLRLRAREVRPGGHLVIAMPGLAADGTYVATTAWPVFTRIKGQLVEGGLITEEQAAALATREYWRTEEEVLAPIRASADWTIEDYVLEKKPCPFLQKLGTGAISQEKCATEMAKAFQGFLSTEFDNALGRVATPFWEAVELAAKERPEDLALSVVMHQLVLKRSTGGR